MIIKRGYHRRSQVIQMQENQALDELLQYLERVNYPESSTRKSIRDKEATDKKGPSAKSVIRKDLTSFLSERGWEREKPLFTKGNPPGSKIHFLKDRIGVLWCMGNRITIGTDILRLERAYHPDLELIDVGVVICPTEEFERYYFGTKEREKENLITFEELLLYLEMVGNILYTPILIIGIKPPKASKKTF